MRTRPKATPRIRSLGIQDTGRMLIGRPLGGMQASEGRDPALSGMRVVATRRTRNCLNRLYDREPKIEA